MLFFVKGEVIVPPRTSAPTRGEVRQLLEVAVSEWQTIISYGQLGKALAGGALPSGRGGCGIWNVASTEELCTIVSQLPAYHLCEWEIIPLIPANEALRLAQEALSGLQGP